MKSMQFVRWHRSLLPGLIVLGAAWAEPLPGQGEPGRVRGVVEWKRLSTAQGDLERPNGQGAEQTATLILDIDKDGVNDFVIADRNLAPCLYWYRRDLEGWTKHVIESTLLRIEAGGAYHDIDRDGDLDIVEGGDSRSNQVWWWENPYPTYHPSTPWVRRPIKSSGENQHHDCIFGDFDGDGEAEFVFWNQNAGGLFFAEIPANPRDGMTWPFVRIFSNTGFLAEGLASGDIDGDGIEDIVGAGRWFKHAGGTTFTPQVVDASQAFTRAAVGQLVPGGRPEIVFVIGDSNEAPFVDGKGPLKWYEWNGSAWVGHDLLPFLTDHGHSLGVTDINGDGHLDIFNAEMDLRGNTDAAVRAFYGDGQGRFTLQVVAAGVDNHESKAGDLDGDGDTDILGKPFARSPGLDIWINERVDLGILPLDRWERHAVDPAQPWLSVFALPGDLDRDGLTDIASGGWWYRNTGDYGSWERTPIGDPLNNVALLHDLDDDGDLDILGTTGKTQTPVHPGPPDLHWARNDGLGNFTILSNVPSGITTDRASSFVQGILPARFQSGGPLEVAISWNFGEFGFSGIDVLTVPANPSQDVWPLRTINAISEGEELAAGDLDGDGDLDLFQGSGWLRNNGDGPWTRITVTDRIGNQTPYDDADRVSLTDLDGDGDLDAVIGLLFITQSIPVDLVWLEHPADPEDEWPLHVAATGIWGGFSLSVGDMDNDRDPDIVVGEHIGLTRLLIFENNGDASGWTRHVVDPGGQGIDHHDGSLATDFDGDGDLDIVSLGWHNQKVWFYENHAVEPSVVVDRTPPTVPAGLTARAHSSTRVELSWTRSTDDRGFVARYDVHRDGALAGTATGTSFTDRTAAPLTTYSYTVVAVDRAGNASAPSDPATASTPAPDPFPPSVPGSLTATIVSPIRVDLIWVPSTDNIAVLGYTVTQEGVVVDTASAPGSVRTGLLPGTAYTFTVSAFDAEGNVSDPARATIRVTTWEPATGLWGGWGFEEPAITSLAIDVSGYRNHGFLENNAGRALAGRFGSAVELSGATGQVNLGPLDVFTDQATFMLWFNADDLDAFDARLLSKSTSANEQDHVWMLSTFTGPTVRFRLKTADGTTSTLVGSGGTIQTGRWHHVAATYDGSAMRLFLDGAPAGVLSKSGGPIARNPQMETWIGSNPGTIDQVFDGRIDEVKIFGTALSAARIVEEMGKPLPPPEVDLEAPGAPTGVTAVGVSASRIDVTWTVSVDEVGVAGYEVFRDGAFLASTTGTSHADTGLPAGATRAYTVRAFDAAGNRSPFSSPPAEASTLGDGAPPSAPAGVTAVAASSSRIDVSWTASTDDVGVTGYEVFRDGAFLAARTGTSHSDTGLPPGATHAYTVRAMDAAGNRSGLSSPPAVASTLGDSTAPTTPAGVTAVAVGSSRIDVSWTASTDDVGVTGYEVFRDGAFLVAKTGTSHSDTGLPPGATHAYTVRAVDAAGNRSAFSSPPAAASTRVDGSPPTAPSGVTAVAVDPSRIDIAWSASTDDVGVSGYSVFRDGVFLTSTTGTSLTDAGLSPNATHAYTVRALDAAGNSSPASSPPAMATTPRDPSILAHYGFEEPRGTVALDRSGNGNHGTLAGAATRRQAGFFGKAMELDGATGRIELGPLETAGTGLTLMAWCRADDFGTADGRIISKATGPAESAHTWMLSTIGQAGSSRLRFRLKTEEGITTLIAGTGNLPLGRWFHAAATYDGSTMRIYLDGVLAGSGEKTGRIAADPAAGVAIGANPGGTRHFDGLIDEVHLRTRALSGPEIRDAMVASPRVIIGPPPGEGIEERPLTIPRPRRSTPPGTP